MFVVPQESVLVLIPLVTLILINTIHQAEKNMVDVKDHLQNSPDKKFP